VENRHHLAPSDEDQFGYRLRHERTRRGWTQAQVAEKLAEAGVVLHPSAIAKMETRDTERPRMITLNEAMAIARIFELSIDQMFKAAPSEFRELSSLCHQWRERVQEAEQLGVRVYVKVDELFDTVSAQGVDVTEGVEVTLDLVGRSLKDLQGKAAQPAPLEATIQRWDKLATLIRDARSD
jgi:transcriptional regulator with XRE-family HTH domain